MFLIEEVLTQTESDRELLAIFRRFGKKPHDRRCSLSFERVVKGEVHVGV
jgi:hypothetical protein